MKAKQDLKSGSGQVLYNKAKLLIPGGTQLLSKRPEMFAPDLWPAYYSKAKGSKIWDLDGKKFLDMSIMGIGANILGYADEDVDKAVIQAIKRGSSSSLNCAEEVELAELLLKLHPWARMVRYSRSGGEAMAVAVRIARASTKRDLVLFSGYHGWTDWYLAANLGDTAALDGQLMPGLQPNGVPRGLKGTALPFSVNDIDGLKRMVRGKEKEIAAIVIEPARGEDAPKDALIELRNFASELGCVLIFDEITSGFRMNAGGIHMRYGVFPDMAVFAKSMGNGYAISAVIGVENVMEAAQTTFISSTNWTERIGPTAALATISKYVKRHVDRHIISIGNSVKKIWKGKAEKYHLDINISGLPTLAAFSFQSEHNQTLMTYFVARMLEFGVLGFRQFKASFAHTHEDIKMYSKAVDTAFSEIASKDPASLLSTPKAHVGFHRLTKE